MNIATLLEALETKAANAALSAQHFLPIFDTYAKQFEALVARVETLEKMVGAPAEVQTITEEAGTVATEVDTAVDAAVHEVEA